MTFEEFKVTVRKKNSFDRYWYYTLSIAVMLLSIVCLYLVFEHPEKFKGSSIVICSLFSLLLLLGVFGFYFLPNRYKIVEIDSGLTLSSKKAILNALINEVGLPLFSEPEQYICFKLKTKWWQGNYNVHFFYDETKFAFSMQGNDLDGGFIDLGATERKRKNLVRRIKDLAV